MNRLYFPIFHWFLNSTQSRTTYLNTVWVQMLHFSTAAPLKFHNSLNLSSITAAPSCMTRSEFPLSSTQFFFKEFSHYPNKFSQRLSSLSSFSKILEISPKCLKVHSPNFISLFILFSKIFHFCHLNFH